MVWPNLRLRTAKEQKRPAYVCASSLHSKTLSFIMSVTKDDFLTLVQRT